MKVVILGAKGQLARSLINLIPNNIKSYSFSREELDISNKEILNEMMYRITPDVVINCAAYTKVDAAELNVENASNINSVALKYLANIARELDSLLIHISTDYVFDGDSSNFYTEEDPAIPINHYGKSKLIGEQEITKTYSKFIILRTSWVFSESGNNFYTTMRDLISRNNQIRVVNDQFGNPTYVDHIAEAIITILESFRRGSINYGIYHYCGKDIMSWYEFACRILAGILENDSKNNAKIIPIPTSEYPTLAKRPHFSSLSCKKIGSAFNIKQHSLDEAFELIARKKKISK